MDSGDEMRLAARQMMQEVDELVALLRRTNNPPARRKRAVAR